MRPRMPSPCAASMRRWLHRRARSFLSIHFRSAGAFEAPIYGILDVDKRIEAHDWGALGKPDIKFHGQPEDESKPTILWDGEWEITYVTFRDMGAAFMVAIVGK